MSTSMIIMGTGGHARVLLDALLLLNARVIGMTDIDPATHGTEIFGVRVIGGDEVIEKHPSQGVILINGIGGVGNTGPRKRIYETWKERGYRFGGVLHPRAVVARGVSLGEGVQVMAGTVIQVESSIGENTIINSSASVDHHCVIGSHCHIAPGVTLSGDVRVGASAHIGVGASVVQGIRLGDGAFVAAGAVVVEDVADGSAVRGVPAKKYERTGEK